MLYFANSGAAVTDTVADGDTLGIFQSRSDQPLGTDAKTGGSWGYVSDAFSNPKANTNSTTGKYDSILYDAPPAGSVLDQRAVKYNFDLPNGSYDVTFGFKLPGGWGGRTWTSWPKAQSWEPPPPATPRWKRRSQCRSRTAP